MYWTVAISVFETNLKFPSCNLSHNLLHLLQQPESAPFLHTFLCAHVLLCVTFLWGLHLATETTLCLAPCHMTSCLSTNSRKVPHLLRSFASVGRQLAEVAFFPVPLSWWSWDAVSFGVSSLEVLFLLLSEDSANKRMERQEGVNLMRLPSGKRGKKNFEYAVVVPSYRLWSKMRCVPWTLDDSVQSSLSSDSYEYYQTEIYDQLPSVQACRSGHDSQGTWERRNVGPESGDNICYGSLHRPQKDKESTLPIRHLTMCIQAKRDARWVRPQETLIICLFLVHCVILLLGSSDYASLLAVHCTCLS